MSVNIGNTHPPSGFPQKSKWAVTFLFSSTIFLSAFLLFEVELIISKSILPWFGGSAAVWTTSLLVFQVLLLAGYIYSHVISVRFSPKQQTRLHLALLVIASLIVLALSFVWPSPITPSSYWKPQAEGNPTLDVAILILVSGGFPFFFLSTTGPLLQRWFARLGGGSGTYKLYSISNIGSLLGLLTFPFVLEPTLRIKTQGMLWSLLFFGFVVGCAMCARKAGTAGEETETAAGQAGGQISSSESSRPASVLKCALWFLLALCPSALLLATTNLLCQQVTTVPLLWVLPLSIYLVTFIVCFDNPRWYRRPLFQPLFAVALFLTCASLIVGHIPSQALLLPILLFLACMVCHGELVRLKPSTDRLTFFYLTVSAGGAAGGIFVAIIAPHMFTFFTEYQLTLGAIVILLLLCLFRDPDAWIFEGGYGASMVLTSCVLVSGYLGGRFFPHVSAWLRAGHFYALTLAVGASGILGTAFLGRNQASSRGKAGFRFTQLYVAGVALLALAALYRSTQTSPEPYLSSRNFYGAVRVFRQNNATIVKHGPTIQGTQLDSPRDKEPTTYYGRTSGVGILLQNHPKRNEPGANLRVGVVGLGAGTLATYGQKGDYFRYYEIDPDIVKLSFGAQPVFSFLRNSAARIDVELGDARMLLERELANGEKQNFDVLVLDAFAGGTVPVHLLTREAFETYWQHMDPRGIIAVNITSGHIDLSPVLEGASSYFHTDLAIDVDEASYPAHSSKWVLLAKEPAELDLPGLGKDSVLSETRLPPRLWTDDYSDILRLEHSFRFFSLHIPHRLWATAKPR